MNNKTCCAQQYLRQSNVYFTNPKEEYNVVSSTIYYSGIHVYLVHQGIFGAPSFSQSTHHTKNSISPNCKPSIRPSLSPESLKLFRLLPGIMISCNLITPEQRSRIREMRLLSVLSRLFVNIILYGKRKSFFEAMTNTIAIMNLLR